MGNSKLYPRQYLMKNETFLVIKCVRTKTSHKSIGHRQSKTCLKVCPKPDIAKISRCIYGSIAKQPFYDDSELFRFRFYFFVMKIFQSSYREYQRKRVFVSLPASLFSYQECAVVTFSPQKFVLLWYFRTEGFPPSMWALIPRKKARKICRKTRGYFTGLFILCDMKKCPESHFIKIHICAVYSFHVLAYVFECER